MKKALPFILVAYVLLSSVYIFTLHREWFLPEPARPVLYFQNDRRNELLEIANYMRERGIDLVYSASVPTDHSTLGVMMERNQLDKVEFINHGVVVFGAFKGRMFFEYHYGEKVSVHVKYLMSKFPEWTYFRIDEHWCFVSNRKSQ